MTEALTKRLLEFIKENRGLDFSQIKKANEKSEEKSFITALNYLCSNGYITLFYGKYYPIIRCIGCIKKGESETSSEISLTIQISTGEIRQFFIADKDDPLFYGGYLIDEKNKILFEKTNGVEFDFKKYDYYLLTAFDNSI